MIKTVFFDVGGTLIHPHPSVGSIYAEIAHQHGITISEKEISERFQAAWRFQKSKSHEMDRAWWENTVRKTFSDILFRNFDHFFSDLYEAFDKPERWSIYSDVKPTLTKLKEKGIRLAVASNWDDRLPGLLDKLKLADYFENKFISTFMKVSKPNPDFFKRALKEMGENPIQALHVGDHDQEDIACAEAAGLRAYLIDRTKKPINSRMLSSLEDLLLRI